MKRAIVYILTLSLILALSACGSMQDNGSVAPEQNYGNMSTSAPENTMLPDINDGVVEDDDGVISEAEPDKLPAQKNGEGTHDTHSGSGDASRSNGGDSTQSNGEESKTSPRPSATAKP